MAAVVSAAPDLILSTCLKCAVRRSVKVIHRHTCERTIEKLCNSYTLRPKDLNYLESRFHWCVVSRAKRG